MNKRIYTSVMREWNRQYRLDHLDEIKEKQKQYSIKHRQRHKIYLQKYYLKNRKKLLKKQKAYYVINKEKRIIYNRGYQIGRSKVDINYRLSRLLRSRLKSAIKNNTKVGSFVRDLGCSIEELKIFLEKKFKPGMTWENCNFRGWHVDHIKPLMSFNLNNRKEFLKACHYTNLQPLWAFDNFSKGAKYEKV